mgnify:FL=1
MNKNWNVFCEGNKKTLGRFEEGKVDYVITSPPYNIAGHRNDFYYDIGYEDGLSESEYLNVRISEFKLLEKALDPSGCICYNLGYSHLNPSLPSKLVVKVEDETEFCLVDKITWKKNTSIPFQTSKQRVSRICEQIYVFSKRPDSFETNKKVTTVNEDTGQSFYEGIDNFVEAKNNDGVETDLKATFSTELVRKLLRMYVPKEKVVYDPFMGIGTTGVACLRNGRRFLGSEVQRKYFDKAKSRIKRAENKIGNKFFEVE